MKLKWEWGISIIFCYEGCLTNFEIGEGGEEAPELYPEVKYTRMDEYLKVYKHEKLCI